MIEAAAEYMRIAFDLFPHERLVGLELNRNQT